MDPHIYSGQPGLPPDSGSSEEGVNYLRRLKTTVAEGAPAAANAAAKGGGKAPAAVTPEWKEKRRSPRLRCSGSVEFRAEGSDVCMWGTLTNVSLHGCYVEMDTSFPVGTKVDLVLKSFGIRVQAPGLVCASGTVRAQYPSVGMGIGFADLEPAQQLQLKQLLDALATGSVAAETGAAQENNMKGILASADPRALLDEIAEFFQKRHVLYRDEFHEIAERVRRS